MPQDDPAAYGDPFGQFLMAAYLQGLVPGNQTSAYNTVLDLLSPGAVAGRQEAGVADVGQQFANMFGGMNLTPDQLGQMQEQAGGLALTAPQESAEKVALNQALTNLLGIERQATATERGQDVQREVGLAGVDVQREDLELRRELLPGQLAQQDAQIAQANSLADYYRYQAQPKPEDPRAQAQMMETNIQSLALYGQPWDPTTGKPAQGVAVTPEQIQTARAMVGLQQQNPVAASTINVLLGSDDPALKAYGRTMFEQATGLRIEEAFWSYWLPGGESGINVVRGGGANRQAILARIEQLERWKGMGVQDPEETQREIDQLKAQLK
jgi:hypothetical protein